MDDFISVAGPIVILLIIGFAGTAIAKGGFTMWKTPSDGDTITNRLLGQGPASEVLRPSPYDRIKARIRGRRSRPR